MLATIRQGLVSAIGALATIAPLHGAGAPAAEPEGREAGVVKLVVETEEPTGETGGGNRGRTTDNMRQVLREEQLRTPGQPRELFHRSGI